MASQEQIRTQVEAYEIKGDSKITNAIHNTARAMVEKSINVQPGQKVLLWFDPTGMPLVKQMYNACVANGAIVTFHMRDFEEDARVLPFLSSEKIFESFAEEKRLVNEADAILLVRNPFNPEAMQNVPAEKTKIYNEARNDAHRRRNIDLKDDGVNWCLFLWPTEYEATKEGLPHDDYIKMYFEACNQPWEAIKEAGAKLKAKLDAGETLELFADMDNEDESKRTHLKMSIKGMTFCNSTIAKNYPGSEVFSAPVMDSVEGQVYFPGEYIYSGKKITGIFLRFEKGKVVEAHAEKGDDALQEILSNGEGARYLGEVAFGTNPGLTKRFFNTLLNEKVAGSFHIAVGHCYEYTEYDGESVHVDNRNHDTPNHWDLTRLMHGDANGNHGGMVLLDRQILQIGGVFVDPELAILNPKGIKPKMNEGSQPILYKKPWVIDKDELDILRNITVSHGLSVQIVAQPGDGFEIGAADCQIYEDQLGIWVLGDKKLDPADDIELFHEIDDAWQASRKAKS